MESYQDNRDRDEMYRYYEARIECLEKKIEELENQLAEEKPRMIQCVV